MTEQLLAEIRSLKAWVGLATAECTRANERSRDLELEVHRLRRDLEGQLQQINRFLAKSRGDEAIDWPFVTGGATG